jgi:hypothetical protein
MIPMIQDVSGQTLRHTLPPNRPSAGRGGEARISGKRLQTKMFLAFAAELRTGHEK